MEKWCIENTEYKTESDFYNKRSEKDVKQLISSKIIPMLVIID